MTDPPKPPAPPGEKLTLNLFGVWETEDDRKKREDRLLNHPDPVIRHHLRLKAGLYPLEQERKK